MRRLAVGTCRCVEIDKRAVGEHLVGECPLPPASSRAYTASMRPGSNKPWMTAKMIVNLFSFPR